ncbi:hypothetical protein [Otoolea muris]|uniref:hypothetical protein n=1 Tax=Otoolea muris TaxID=2941515 RepID=UPI00203C150A|nr:hypothetical protein [Otoolea muris]
MSNDYNTSHNEISPELQGSILWGILGSVIGMIVCILVMLLCSLCQMESSGIMLQLFAGLVIGWFYRLFHGWRSKTAAYVTVGVCTVSASVLWGVLLALLPVFVSPDPFTAADWGRLWGKIWELLLLCAGLGMIGFFFTRKSLLAYADWKRGPWHVAYAGGNGYSYNLLPEKLPAVNPPAYFALHSRFASGTRLIVEGSSLRWRRRLRKDRMFSVRDIAGVVLGPGNGCNVLYGKDYQVLAKFASSMEHADLMFLWLLQKKVFIVNAPAGWRSPAEDSPEPKPVKSSIPQQQFTLRLKRSARIGFAGMGWFLLLIGLAPFLAVIFSTVTIAERSALIIVGLVTMGIGIVCLRTGTVCQVEIDGEQVRVVSRFGRTKEFSVKEVSSVSKSLGWIVLYDREFNTLAKIDSYLENLDKLKEYFAFYGIKM